MSNGSCSSDDCDASLVLSPIQQYISLQTVRVRQMLRGELKDLELMAMFMSDLMDESPLPEAASVPRSARVGELYQVLLHEHRDVDVSIHGNSQTGQTSRV